MKRLHRLGTLSGAAILLTLSPMGESLAQQDSIDASHPTPRAPRLATCSPDGDFFVVVTEEGRITYGRTSDGATLRTFYQCHPKAMEFSPDGRLLASVGESDGSPARIKVWNVDDGTLLCQMETESGSDSLLSFSPDALLLVSTSGGFQVNFWQLPEGTLRCCATTSQAISCIAFSNEGGVVVAICADAKPVRIPVP